MLSVVTNAPSGSDLERIDVQIGALKGMIKDAIERMVNPGSSQGKNTGKSAETAGLKPEPLPEGEKDID